MENPSSPKAKKACQVRSNVKIMLISFFGANGILHEGICSSWTNCESTVLFEGVEKLTR
jgi:hypothetical protein